MLEATGADTISQIQEGGLKSLAAMVRQLDKLEPQSKAMVQELITGLLAAGWNCFLCRNLTKAFSAIT